MRLSHTLSCQPLGRGTNVIAPEDRSDDHAVARNQVARNQVARNPVARNPVARNPEAPATGRRSIATTSGSSAQYYDPRLAATPPPAIA
jgi:hypothetical protein